MVINILEHAMTNNESTVFDERNLFTTNHNIFYWLHCCLIKFKECRHTMFGENPFNVDWAKHQPTKIAASCSAFIVLEI